MYGLALEGGGAKGAFHMGAVKALLELGYKFGGITGTSIGALNGAAIAQGDFDAGYKMWEEIDATTLFDIDETYYKKVKNRELDKETISRVFEKVKKVIDNKGIDTGKMRKVIEGLIDEQKLRESKIDFGLVTVSLTDKKPLELYKEDIPQGKIVDYLMASASLPVFKKTPLDDKYFIDGAFFDNCPINLLAKKGYNEIFAVRTLAVGILQNLRYSDIKVIDIIPSEDLGGTMNFDNELIQKNLKMGYFDVFKAVRGLKGRKFYLEPSNDDMFFDMLANMPDECAEKFAGLIGQTGMEKRRMIFEVLIPKLCRALDIGDTAAYQDIIINTIETLAEDNGIERFKIYTWDEFIEEIKRSDGVNHNKTDSSKIMKNMNVISKFSKKLSSKELSRLIFQVVTC